MKKLGAAITVAALAMTVITLFGDEIRSLSGMSANALAGETSITRRTHATRDELEKKALKNFGDDSAGYGAPAPSAPAVATGNSHQAYAPNRFVEAREDHLSTFAIDVDTASYTLSRRTIQGGQLPVPEGVRVEEWVNAFKYDLPKPADAPFAVSVEGAPSPYAQGRTLVKVALQGRVVANADRLPAHLVLLVDESCSMSGPDRLPMAKDAMRLLVEHLNPRDTVAVVTYANGSRIALEPTSAAEPSRIFQAIDSLSNKGGTAMGSGMELAYRLAVKQVSARSTTRVLVFTDGDANIGDTTPDKILASVKGAVSEGVTLTTVGFGMGNYRDSTLERLADSGNGESVYIDSLDEARRVFGRDVASTLEHIAKDVKVQVDFDPQVVAQYRLLGYENRAVADQDFRNDTVDGGELGAGHSVTALYEVALTGKPGALGTVRVRGQRVDGRGAFEVAQPMTREVLAGSLAEASTELRFATAVALSADVLRGNGAATDWPLARIVDLASEATRGLPEREEFVGLMRTAVALQRSGASVAQRVQHDPAGY